MKNMHAPASRNDVEIFKMPDPEAHILLLPLQRDEPHAAREKMNGAMEKKGGSKKLQEMLGTTGSSTLTMGARQFVVQLAAVQIV